MAADLQGKRVAILGGLSYVTRSQPPGEVQLVVVALAALSASRLGSASSRKIDQPAA